MNWTTRLILIALVAFAAALGGTYAGRVLFAPERQSETELHALLHSELELDVAQEAKIEAIEQRFATRRKALELEMRAANAHLAEAMEVEHGYGPQVTAAIRGFNALDAGRLKIAGPRGSVSGGRSDGPRR